jgi:hypothetical protein
MHYQLSTNSISNRSLRTRTTTTTTTTGRRGRGFSLAFVGRSRGSFEEGFTFGRTNLSFTRSRNGSRLEVVVERTLSPIYLSIHRQQQLLHNRPLHQIVSLVFFFLFFLFFFLPFLTKKPFTPSFFSSFLDSVDRIADVDYVPSAEDLLRVRTPPTSISELDFNIANLNETWRYGCS